MNFPLEDSTTEDVPIIVKEILNHLLSNKPQSDLTQKDIFFVLIIVLMLENGFLPLSNETCTVDISTHIGISKLSLLKKESGFYKEKFVLLGLHDIIVDIIMSPVGSAVIVNAVINDMSSEIYSVCLPLSRFIVSLQASTIPMMFRDLKHLSSLYKNRIVSPVKSSILSYCGYPSASLVGIPEDIFFNLMMYLNIRDILNVTKTCRRLKALLENECFWHALCKRDFKITIEGDSNDWKKIYKETYEAQYEQKSVCTTGTIHDLMDISDMVSYIDNPLWGEII